MLTQLTDTIEPVLAQAILSMCLYTLTYSNTTEFTYVLLFLSFISAGTFLLLEAQLINYEKSFSFAMQSLFSFVTVINAYLMRKIICSVGLQLFTQKNLLQFCFSAFTPYFILIYIFFIPLLLYLCLNRGINLKYIPFSILCYLAAGEHFFIPIINKLSLTQVLLDLFVALVFFFNIVLLVIAIKQKKRNVLVPNIVSIALTLFCLLSRCVWIRTNEIFEYIHK